MYEWPLRNDGGRRPESISCQEVTGMSCSYIAQRDESPEGLSGGSLIDQVIAMLYYHVAMKHPGVSIPAEARKELRQRLSKVKV